MMPVELSQDGEVDAGELCSEKQRDAHMEAGGVQSWTSGGRPECGQGRSRRLPPLFLVLVWLAPTAANAAGSVLTPLIKKPPLLLQSPQAERPPTPEELAAARGVEAMMIDHLMQEMRKSVPENEFMPPSQGEKIFKQMLDTEYARILSEGGGIGIADLVLAQLRGKR